ncbi:IBR domain containing protein [Histomonas meleagridis]|uniref:IBR domain containing protein n=1 Tax=Histomonas meleagridis TaxID=135588 RepID=UPI00355A1D8F|nr:IBR domain containing protein [Histomonas meleagridis]KAH0799467.1 IBR domain containing protein [Histomonas meleagridis]
MSDDVDIYGDFDFIRKVAQEVRDFLISTNEEFYQSIINYYNENNWFPKNLFYDILKEIDEHCKENPELEQLRSNYKNIFTNADYDETNDFLHSQIFFPVEENVQQNFQEEEDIISEIEEEEIEYTKITPVVTISQLVENQEKILKNVSQTLFIHPEVASILLQNYAYNDNQLFQDYSDHDVLSTIGITPEQASDPIHLHPVPPDVPPPDECPICCCDDSPFLALPCNHYICTECWKTHIKQNIATGHPEIFCQILGCKCRVTTHDVETLCPDLAKNFQQFVLESEIVKSNQYRHCLNSHCQNLLTINSVGLCNVATCTCGQRVCWKCGEEAHAPLSCENLIRWREINQDAVQGEWIYKNTKPCPKCKSRIEKNGGCNHMTCRKEAGGCGYEFCWICGHDWKTHTGDAYSCNQYTDFDSDMDKQPQDKPELNLRRLGHYYARYVNHITSSKQEHKIREKISENLMKRFSYNKNFVFDEAFELCSDAFRAIDTARSVLIWSYPHAFYMVPGSTELNLFEFVQRDVEKNIETVTFLIENKVVLTQKELRDAVNLLISTTEVLNKHVDQYSH